MPRDGTDVTYRFRCLACGEVVFEPVEALFSALSLAMQIKESLSGHCDRCIMKLDLKRVVSSE